MPPRPRQRLFVQHAAMVRPGFEVTESNAADIAAICRRLDGLPLAIELAAARARLLAPKALLARLGSSLPLGAADAARPSRQQTLRATIGWSYDLLTPAAAAVLARLGVFTGGCDLDALAAVAGPGAAGDPLEVAADLMNVSLVTVTEGPDGEPRIGTLEMIREYALERLAEAGGLALARRRHAEHYAKFAEAACAQLARPGPARDPRPDRGRPRQPARRLGLVAGFQPGQPSRPRRARAIGLRLVQALGHFWNIRGHAGEGRWWLQQAIEMAAADAGAPLARVAHWLGPGALQHGEPDAAVQLFERSLAIWRDLGDRDGQARELNSLGGTHRPRRRGRGAPRAVRMRRHLPRDRQPQPARRGPDEHRPAGIDAGHFEQASTCCRRRSRCAASWATAGLGRRPAIAGPDQPPGGRRRQARELLADTADYVASSGDTELLARPWSSPPSPRISVRPVGGPPGRCRRSPPAKAGMPITTGNARAVPGPRPRGRRTRVGCRAGRRPRAQPAAGGHPAGQIRPLEDTAQPGGK